MKFTCERDVIMREITVAHEIISSRNALSILSNVFLSAEEGTLVIRATDLKVGFQTRLPVDLQQAGSITVFCDKFLGILRSLPEGEVEFEATGEDTFVIRPVFKKIDFNLKSISSEKFPELQVAPEESFFEFPQKELISMISQTIFAVSDDETRYFMNGVFMENSDGALVMVATDGRRLSYMRSDAVENLPDFPSVIVPPKILNLIKRLASGEGNVRLGVTEKHIFVEFDNQSLYSSLIEGQFPNYRRVIPAEQENVVVVTRSEFLEAIRRVSLLVEKSRRVYLKLAENSITVSSEQSEIGVAREEISCKYQGDEIIMALNYSYLVDPLRVIDVDEVELHFTDPTKAVTIQAVPHAPYFHIVMPMQLE